MIINKVTKRYEHTVTYRTREVTGKILDHVGIHLDRVGNDVFIHDIIEDHILNKLRLAQTLATLVEEFDYALVAKFLEVIREIDDEIAKEEEELI